MEPLTIILLTVGIAVVTALVAWFGPRLRHWRKGDDLNVPRDDSGRPEDGHRRSG